MFPILRQPASDTQKEIDNEFWLGLSGVLSILFGVYVFLFPGVGVLALAWLIGIYAVIFGVFFIALALRVRNQQQSGTSGQSTRAPV